MPVAVRYLIATLVILAQTSLGRALCACAPMAAPMPKSCPMAALKTACGCCDKAKPSPDKKDCQIGSQKAKESVVPGSVEVPQPVVALAPESVEPILLARNDIPVVVPTHLVIPRIRPPELGGHLLRAPPVL